MKTWFKVPVGKASSVFVAAAVLFLAGGPATAQPAPSTVRVPGTVLVGPMARNVTISVSCEVSRGKMNYLLLAMDVPTADLFKRDFDVNQFDGPTGIGARSHVVATAATGRAQIDFAAAGSFGAGGGPGSTFTFGGSFQPGPNAKNRTSFKEVQTVVGILATGPSKITWKIENPRRGGSPMDGSADVTEADSVLIRSSIAPCLGRLGSA